MGEKGGVLVYLRKALFIYLSIYLERPFKGEFELRSEVQEQAKPSKEQ